MARPRSLITKAEFARELNISKGRVSQLLKLGLPVRDGRIDRVEGACWYRANIARPAGSADVAVNGARVAGLSASSAGVDAPKASESDIAAAVHEEAKAAGDSPTPLTQARILATQEIAAIKGIERRKLEGALLKVDEVDQTWAEVLQVLKDRLRLIADNIAPVLATCGTEAECRSVVCREIDDALAAVSKGVAELVNT
jgi:hypothetical protein